MEKLMYRAFVLVKNLDSNSDELIFEKFKLRKITEDDDDLHKKARKCLFPGQHADKDDWIYERNYHNLIPREANSIIINDIIETFLLTQIV